jgi:hypothetical protein
MHRANEAVVRERYAIPTIDDTDPEVYYYTSGTLNGLHGTLNGTLNGLHGTIGTVNGTLNGLHGTIRAENGWNAFAAISKFTFRKLSLSIIVIITIYIFIYKP